MVFLEDLEVWKNLKGFDRIWSFANREFLVSEYVAVQTDLYKLSPPQRVKNIINVE